MQDAGYCECGCGGLTPIATETRTRLGWIKGQPKRFMRGHHKGRTGPDYVVDENGCWIWQHGMSDTGYGSTTVDGRGMSSHRWMYELLVGPIPDGLHLDHVWDRGCRSRACCNPAHLEPVTHAENMRRAAAAKTHCPHGHEFSPENTYIRPDTGHRMCRACGRASNLRQYYAKAAKNPRYQPRLGAENVAVIRSELRCGVKQVDLAKRFGVHPDTIRKIKIGRAWRDVP